MTHSAAVAARIAGLNYPITCPLDSGPDIGQPVDGLLNSRVGTARQTGELHVQKAHYSAYVAGPELRGPLEAADEAERLHSLAS